MEDNECFETAREYFPKENNFRVPYSVLNHYAGGQATLGNGEPTQDISTLSGSFLRNRNAGYNRSDPLDIVSLYRNNAMNDLSKCNGDNEKIYEQYKLLQDQFKAKCIALQEIQKQKMLLKEENQKLTVELENEKKKAVRINKKIKHIQENQNVLLRLKDEYKSLKDIHLTRRDTLIDKEIQTIYNDGNEVVCCSENTIVVKESDLEAIQDTVQLLKQKIMDKLWINNTGNQSKIFLEEMSILQDENKCLKTNLISKIDENDKLKNDLKQKTYTLDKVRKDKNILKKIILKLEKRQRDFVKKYQIKDKESSRLIINETERNIVQHIVKRYLIKKTNIKQHKKKKTNQTNTYNETSSFTSNCVTSSSNAEQEDMTCSCVP